MKTHNKPITNSCPICNKKTILTKANPYRPFCSERCQIIDLGAWADESYSIQGEDGDAVAQYVSEE